MSDSAVGVRHRGTPVVQSTGVGQPDAVGAAGSAGSLAVDAGTGAARPDAAAGAAGGPILPAPAQLDGRDLMALLTFLQNKINESRVKGTQDDIKARGKEKETKNEEAVEKLKELANKSPAGKIAMKVFAWVGVALSFVVAGVVGVVSGGAAAAPLLMLAVASAAILISQESGLTDKIMDATGMDEKAKMGFAIGLAAAMLIANIVATVATGGASAAGSAAQVAETTTTATSEGVQAAGTLAEAGAGAAESAAELSSGASETAQVLAETGANVGEVTAETTGTGAKAASDIAEETQQASVVVRTLARKLGVSSERILQGADKMRQGVKVASGASQVGLGASTTANAATEYDAGMTRADTQRIKAAQAKLNALDEEDLRRLRQIIEMITQNVIRLTQAMTEGHKVVMHATQAPV